MAEAKTKRERLSIFLDRLQSLPRSGSADEAKVLIDRTLNEVENEFTDVPYRPETRGEDGRMYPADEDSRTKVSGRDDLRRYRHRSDETYIGQNGAILIRSISSGAVLLDLPGADGEGLEI